MIKNCAANATINIACASGDNHNELHVYVQGRTSCSLAMLRHRVLCSKCEAQATTAPDTLKRVAGAVVANVLLSAEVAIEILALSSATICKNDAPKC